MQCEHTHSYAKVHIPYDNNMMKIIDNRFECNNE